MSSSNTPSPAAGSPSGPTPSEQFTNNGSAQGNDGDLGRVSPDWLLVDGDHNVRISLSVPAPTWFHFLSQLTGAICFVRTPVAVLASDGPVPAMNWSGDPVLPRSQGGVFSPNLAEHASLWAIRESYPNGPLYLLEVLDARGWVAQRVVVPPGESLVRYRDFVCAHQSPIHRHRPWLPPNHNASARRGSSLARRIPMLRQRLEEGSPEVRSLTLPRVVELLARAVGAGQPIQTRAYNSSLIFSVAWIPEFHAPAWTSDPSAPATVRFLGQGTGLELHHLSRGTAWLWTGTCSCCGEEKWAVEVGTETDDLALSIAAVDAFHEADWRGFLEPLLVA